MEGFAIPLAEQTRTKWWQRRRRKPNKKVRRMAKMQKQECNGKMRNAAGPIYARQPTEKNPSFQPPATKQTTS